MGYVAGSPKDSFRSFIYTTDVDQLHFVLFTLSGRDTKSTIPASSCDSSHLYRFSVEDPVELLFPFRVKRFSSSHSFPYESFCCRRAAQDGKMSVIYMTRKIPVKFLLTNGVFRKRSPVCDGKLWFVIVEFLAGKKSADAHWKEKEKELTGKMRSNCLRGKNMSFVAGFNAVKNCGNQHE